MRSIKQKEHAEYLKSDEWQSRRNKILNRDEHKCRLCDSTEDLNVHHINYDNYKDEYQHELITLCKSCHYKAHKGFLVIMLLNDEEIEAFRLLKSKLSLFNKDVICVKISNCKVDKMVLLQDYTGFVQ